MVEAIHEGKLKAMYVIGEEMSIVDSNANYSAQLSQSSTFSSSRHFFSNTGRLRRCGSSGRAELEKDGTSLHGTAHSELYEVFEPLRGCRPDWRIIQDVANQLGANWHYEDPPGHGRNCLLTRCLPG